MIVTRQDIINEARTYMPKTRWQHLARVKGVAVDCIGLLICIALYFNLPGCHRLADDERLKAYSRSPNPDILLSGCDDYMDRVNVYKVNIADVLVMRFRDGPQHFALVSRLDPMYVIHSYAMARRVVENGVNIAGASIVRAYSFRGIA